MAKSVLPNNGLALCIIIIVVVGLFLHYELGYNLDLFSVGGRRRPNNGHIGHKRHKPWYHPHSWFTHNIYNTHTHPQNIFTVEECIIVTALAKGNKMSTIVVKEEK